MTQQQKEQLIKELERLFNEANSEMKKANNIADKEYYRGVKQGIWDALQLINQTTVNRSSTEPKIIEG